MTIGNDYLLRESRLRPWTITLESCYDLLLFYLRMLVIIIGKTILLTDFHKYMPRQSLNLKVALDMRIMDRV